jgi:RhtB (resistance to homoserine/threonine) family protein
MTYLPELLVVALAHLLAVMSPGPDFFLTMRNSLAYSRRTGIYTAAGIALGLIVHIAYSLLGIGFIISKSIILFTAIKFLGAGYLIYIGYKCIRSKSAVQKTEELVQQTDIVPLKALKMGFLTNVLNPKATLFFLALFTQVISGTTPVGIQLIYGIEMVLMTFVWFTLVAALLSHTVIRSRFTKIQSKAEKVFGVILIALGIKVALSTSK